MYEAELKEYETLRDEILFYLRTVARLLMFSVVAVGAIFGYGLQAKNGYVFLIGPLVVMACLRQSISYFTSVVRIATYIRCVLEDRVPGLNWETAMFKIRTKPVFRFGFHSAARWIVDLLIYNALAIGCLVAAFTFEDWKITLVPSILSVLGLIYLSWDLYHVETSDKFLSLEAKIKSLFETRV